LHRLARQAQPAREHLQRHLAIERQLASFIDDAHAAATQLANDREVAEPARVFRLVHRGHESSLAVASAYQAFCDRDSTRRNAARTGAERWEESRWGEWWRE